MIVWGGERASYGTLNDGGSYDPTTDKWSALAATTLAIRKNHSAIWTGTEMIIWGGYGQAVHATGAAYNPTTDSWRAIAAPPSGFPQRHQHVAVWTGTEMLIAGGRQYSDSGETTAAAAYDPATDTWRILAPAPSSLLYHGVVWTGTEVLVSASNLTVYSYDPALDIWTTLTAPGTATSGTSGAAIWLQGLLFTGAQTLFDPGTVFYPYAKQ
jgi:N-acetylneuraminic acid mutarotase